MNKNQSNSTTKYQTPPEKKITNEKEQTENISIMKQLLTPRHQIKKTIQEIQINTRTKPKEEESVTTTSSVERLINKQIVEEHQQLQLQLTKLERQKGKYNSKEKENSKDEKEIIPNNNISLPTFRTVNKLHPPQETNLKTMRNKSTERRPTQDKKKPNRSVSESPDRFDSITQILEQAKESPEYPEERRVTPRTQINPYPIRERKRTWMEYLDPPPQDRTGRSENSQTNNSK